MQSYNIENRMGVLYYTAAMLDLRGVSGLIQIDAFDIFLARKFKTKRFAV